MIHSLNPEQDVLPDEVMELAGAIYGGCIVSASLNIYVQKDKQGIRDYRRQKSNPLHLEHTHS
jgi:hypothetical protein